jgi:diamine N-acetyltransferase
MPKSLPEVHLRAIEPEDLDALYAIENDHKIWNIGVTNVPYSRYVLHDYIAHSRNDIYADGQVRLIIEAEGRGVVGVADLTNFDPKNNRAEIGIIIMEPFRHQGYAVATLKEMKRYAADILHLHQLYAVIACSNTPAIKMFKDVGVSADILLHQWLYDGKKYCDARLLQTFL